MTEEFASLTVRDLSGVFAARRLGRELAAGLALERQDQVRVATALSEVCRSAVTAGQTAVIAFAADPAHLVLTVTVDGELPEDGVAGAARLMDTVVAEGRVVRMLKRRPPISQSDIRAVREQLSAMLPGSTLEELRRNNDDLIAALEDLKGQKEQLLLLNAELQDTNRGVMALYSELSEELEQTNRGVVALYRELDEKSEQLRAGVGVQGPVLGQRQPRAADPAELDHRADPAAGRPGGRARRRAAVPGGADQEHHRLAAHAGQRPPRRRQGGIGAARHRPGRGQPARAAGHAARAHPADRRGQAGRRGGVRRRRSRHRADRRDRADRDFA